MMGLEMRGNHRGAQLNQLDANTLARKQWWFPYAILLASVAVFIFIGLALMRSNLGHPVEDMAGALTWEAAGASFYFPPRRAEAEEWRQAAYRTCSTQSARSLALELDARRVVHTGSRAVPTQATPKAVANGYVEIFFRSTDLSIGMGVDDLRAIYAGCLQGFRATR